MNSADMCRERGWAVGDVLVGDEGYGLDAVEITAIGKSEVLAQRVAARRDGKWAPVERPRESSWDLFVREWTLATPEQLAAIKPPAGVTFGDLEPGDWFYFDHGQRGDAMPIMADDEGGYTTAEGTSIRAVVRAQEPVTRMTPLEVAQWLVRHLPVSIVEHEEPAAPCGKCPSEEGCDCACPDADALPSCMQHDRAKALAQARQEHERTEPEHDRTEPEHEPVDLQAGDRISVIADGEIGNIRASVAVREHTQPAPGYKVAQWGSYELWRGLQRLGRFNTRAEAVARSWELCDDEERSQ